jgi:SAM-dependent methyltransferase
MYEKVIKELKIAYDNVGEGRDQREIPPWKVSEQKRFLSLLQDEEKKSLLEVGAGTGVHGLFYQNHGLEVICTDLSPEMVRVCRKKGLIAYKMDFLNLNFPDGSFDAVLAFNSLLHVPKANFSSVLGALKKLLKPNGLFYLGQYGGIDKEGPAPEDKYIPKRFYSLFLDEDIQLAVQDYFQIENFTPIHPDGEKEIYFQALILRNPA